MLSEDKQTVQTVLKKEQVKVIKKIAEEQGLSMSAYIRVAVLEKLKEDLEKEEK